VIRQENSQFRNVELWAALLPRWTVTTMWMALLVPLNDPETYDALGNQSALESGGRLHGTTDAGSKVHEGTPL
jgi:hypothetical protein